MRELQKQLRWVPALVDCGEVVEKALVLQEQEQHQRRGSGHRGMQELQEQEHLR